MPADKNAKIETLVEAGFIRKTRGRLTKFQRRRICPFPVEGSDGATTLSNETASFRNLHEIDSQALLSNEGYAIIGARRLLFFQPCHAWRASSRLIRRLCL